MAVAVDDVKVGVVKVKEGQVEVEMVYSRHSDYVRGLAWSGSDNSYSAGWDNDVASRRGV